MQLPLKAETLDSLKKSIGTTLLVGAAIVEALGEFGIIDARFGAITTSVAVAGAWLAGFGMLGARGKKAQQILVQAFGTDKPSEVQQEAIQVAARVASLAPPAPAADNAITWPKTEQRASLPNPPPPPRSKP